MIVRTPLPKNAKDAERAEGEHWAQVAANEAKLKAAREWAKKRMGA